MSNFFEKAKRLKDNVEQYGITGIGYTIEENIREELGIGSEPTKRITSAKKVRSSGKADAVKRELRPGDIVAATRKIPYQHFGVYIGNNKVIHFAAESGDWGGKITIHEAPFEEFLRDSKGFEILEFDEKRSEAKRYEGLIPMGNALEGSSMMGAGVSIVPALSVIFKGVELYKDYKYHLYTPEETVQRAKEVAKKFTQQGKPFEVLFNGQKYNLVFNNCEHFAIWCKTGIHESKQVENVIRFITGMSNGVF